MTKRRSPRRGAMDEIDSLLKRVSEMTEKELRETEEMVLDRRRAEHDYYKKTGYFPGPDGLAHAKDPFWYR